MLGHHARAEEVLDEAARIAAPFRGGLYLAITANRAELALRRGTPALAMSRYAEVEQLCSELALSYEAEDLIIRRAAAAYPPPLDTLVEVRNQARVHLWFEDRFGEPYAPLSSSAEALTRFTTTMFAVGAALEDSAGFTAKPKTWW